MTPVAHKSRREHPDSSSLPSTTSDQPGGGTEGHHPTPTLSRLIATRQLNAARFVTHHFCFDEFNKAYEVFSDAKETGALKVVLTRGS